MRLLNSWFRDNQRAKNAKLGEQTEKIIEEAYEQMDAHRENLLDPCHANQLHEIEETIDVMVAADGKLDMFPAADVMEAVESVRRKGRERGDW